MRSLLIVLVLTLLAGCDQQSSSRKVSHEDIDELFDMGEETEESCPRAIHEQQLQKRGDLFYTVNEETPYSGRVRELPEICFKDGKKNGTETSLYSDGKMQTETNYKDGKKHGAETTRYTDKANVVSPVSPYKNPKRSVTNYSYGNRDGLDTTWYPNGQRETETNYKDGNKDGLQTTWFTNGQKETETHYKDGIKDGLEITWNENGEKFQQRDCTKRECE